MKREMELIRSMAFALEESPAGLYREDACGAGRRRLGLLLRPGFSHDRHPPSLAQSHWTALRATVHPPAFAGRSGRSGSAGS